MRTQKILTALFMIILPAGIAVSGEPTVAVHDAWIREAPPNVKSLAGYMTMKNNSKKDQALLSASSKDFESVMIHRTEYKDGMAHMTHQKQVIIPPRRIVKFAPGGYHLMLINPKRSFRVGDETVVNLVFSDKSSLNVKFSVRKDLDKKKNKSMSCGSGKCGAGM